MKVIEINSSVEDRVPFQTIKIIQDDIKNLTSENCLKLKRSILKHGFTDPINVWCDETGHFGFEGALCSLDGTQRVRVLTVCENEGYTIPDVPINRIKAASFVEAKQILLSMVSQYGTLNPQGFMEFSMDAGFANLDDLLKEMNLPGVDLEELKEEFTEDHTDKKDKKERKCPHCGESLT